MASHKERRNGMSYRIQKLYWAVRPCGWHRPFSLMCLERRSPLWAHRGTGTSGVRVWFRRLVHWLSRAGDVPDGCVGNTELGQLWDGASLLSQERGGVVVCRDIR